MKIPKIRQWKIKYKLIAAMYLVLIPVLLGITFFIYVQTTRSVQEQLSNAYQNLAVSIDSTISYMEADIQDIMTYVAINDDFRYVLNATEGSPPVQNPLVWNQETATGFVSEMLYIKNYIQCFALYAENGVNPYVNARKAVVINNQIEDIKNLPVIQESVAHLGDIAKMRMEADDKSLISNNKEARIVFGKAVMTYNKEKNLGYICAAIDETDYTDIFEHDRLEANESIYLYDENGNELTHLGAASPEDLQAFSSGKINFQRKKGYGITKESYIFTSFNKEHGYTIFYVVPKENWSKQLESAVRVPLIIAISLILAALPIFILVMRFITIPLQKLHESMLRLQEGDFKQNVPIYSDDEMGDVTRVYNEMVTRIDDLIDKNYVMVLRERESELDILQAQINPHFLYNTLDCLYWDAYNMGAMELAENIMALSELFRLALSRGKGIVSVDIEFKLIENYLHIQKMRFEKRMDYKVTLTSDIQQKQIPKLILQPFVENAIVHGLENTENIGFIEVHGFLEEEYMIFKISDNGVGMTEEQVSQLFADEKKQYSNQRISKYAINNVRERLKLCYGEQYQLHIHSTLGVGTIIVLKIPL